MNNSPISIIPLPIFSDNYVWLLHNTANSTAAVVDPGDADDVLRWIHEHNVHLTDIIITHHHPDHVGGIEALLQATDSKLPVFGSEHDNKFGHIHGQTKALCDGEEFSILCDTLQLSSLTVPGHTLGHMAYVAARLNALFCGDTLFLGGCGRLFEGTPVMMHESLNKLMALPATTMVYCAHEYTQDSYEFARTIMPNDRAIEQRLVRCRRTREQGHPTVPATLGEELRDNIFLRCEEADVQQATGTTNALNAFTEIRSRRDVY